MRRTRSFLLALAVLVPAAARAQFTIGARTGYAIPLGDADPIGPMSDITTGLIPLQLDIGYRIPNSALTVGGYLSYGFGSAAGAQKDACDFVGQSCSTRTFRIGAQVLYSFWQPNTLTLPWIGLGIGYDSLKVSASGSDETWSGWEFLILQGGVDWRLTPGFTLGGFASLSFGQYDNFSAFDGTSGTIADTRTHEWLTIGIRGAFGPGAY